MNDKNKPRPRNPAGRDRPRMTNYYRSGATPSKGDSPFVQKLPKPNKLKKYSIRFLDLLLIIGLLFLLVHSLIINPHAKLIVSDNSVHSFTNYQDASNSYLRALRDHNKITFDTNGLVKKFKND